MVEMWAVEVMTKTRCRVGTVPAISAFAQLVTSTFGILLTFIKYDVKY